MLYEKATEVLLTGSYGANIEGGTEATVNL